MIAGTHPGRAASRSIIFIHSSDELYGADRILLDILDALPEEWRTRAEFWLPTDVEHGPNPLCVELRSRGAVVRHVGLPILRRSYRTPRQLVRIAGRAVRLRARLRQARPAALYCTTSATLMAAASARASGVPLVMGHVQEFWSRGDRFVLAPLALLCHRLIAISEPVRAALPACVVARTTVVLNATHAPANFVPVTEHEGPLRYLVASRWNGWKGHRTLMSAWDRAHSPGHLTVLGGAPPSGEAVDVVALVAGLREPATVDVVGEVEDVETYVRAADVVVVPSDHPEPFGLIAVEAFAQGRPVLASRGGGLAETVAEGFNGWLYPMGDADALATILLGLTREDVSAAGIQARASYDANFTAARYAAQWRAAVGF